MRSLISIVFIGLFVYILTTCANGKVQLNTYKTAYVFVIVMDGPRYSETWGYPIRANIPRMDTILSVKGIINTAFYNNGETNTTAGHTALTTGHYQSINNSGSEYPMYPSIFQFYRKITGNPSNLSWLIASKDKLEILSNTTDISWKDKFLPSTNCGVSGLGSGYRHDSITFPILMNVLSADHPKLLYVNFREPDFSGHAGDWMAYLNGIKQVDEYIYQVWEFIQSDPIYKNKTTLFVTNDHGRHLDGVSDGFLSHGDGCDGCRHINFYAFGPDFKKGVEINEPRELIDIHATIIELLGLPKSSTTGKVMNELFN